MTSAVVVLAADPVWRSEPVLSDVELRMLLELRAALASVRGHGPARVTLEIHLDPASQERSYALEIRDTQRVRHVTGLLR